MKLQEHQLQSSCVRWFRYQYPNEVLFAVPNGGARSATTGAMLKKEGVMAGVSDLILLHPANGYHGLMIEMKTKEGKLTTSQRIFEKKATKKGYLYSVCRSFDEFRQLVEWYLS